MYDLGEILAWLRYHKIKKNRRIVESVLTELHSLTVTLHGRILLAKVCEDEENGLAPELRHLYWVLLRNAPIDQWAPLN